MAAQEIGFEQTQQTGSESNAQLEAPKRKRGRPKKQQLLEPQALQANELSKPSQTLETSTGTLDPSAPRITPVLAPTRKRAAGKKKKFSLTVFDKDALKLVRRGVASAAAVSEKLGVGKPAVQSRFEEMEKAGLLAQKDGTTEFHLTVKGYNDYSPDSTETTLEEKARKKSDALKNKEEKRAATAQQEMQSNPTTLNVSTLQKSFENREKKQSEIMVLPENGKQSSEEKPSESERVDLSEMLARGAPKPGEEFSKPAQKARRSDKTVAEITIPTSQNPGGAPGQPQGEKCVLCRTDFVLSVGGGNPKYGHCFCGAAYHKDCYQGVLETSFECIQCGKKLEIIRNKASLDEVRKIKDVFG